MTDRIIAALVGGPVRALTTGTLALWAIGHWLGWWAVALIFAIGVGDTILGAVRLLAGGRAR